MNNLKIKKSRNKDHAKISESTVYCLLSSENTTDKQNALRRECTFKIEIVLEIGVAGVKFIQR